MGALIISIVAALAASPCRAASLSGSLEVLVRSPVSVKLGDTTTLPCWLNPPQNAEGFEVSWYRGNYNTPIMFFRGKKFENASQEASYVGRVSFGLKDVASGGLTAGDVSLTLNNATVKDAGDYTCYVSSEQGYDRASVSLAVTQTGSPPLLSAVWKENNMVNMSCRSEGWSPEPRLHWSDQKQVLTPKSLKYSKDSSGLQSVHSWLLVSSSTEVSCSVSIPGKEAKEARVHLENPPQPESGSFTAGWVAIALLLTALLVLLGVLYFKKRGKRGKSGNYLAEERNPCLPQGVVQPTHHTTPSKCYVNVTLHNVGNQYLKIKDGKVRDGQCAFPDGDRVTCVTAIKGTPGFSSGQHYWEVSLGTANPNLIKQSWWVGVTSATVIPTEVDFTPSTSNGYWFLSSSPDREDSLQFNTDPNILLPNSRLQTVGVYLNYDSGELSFYNVENHSLIGSLTTTFTGEIFPFFNPGKGDKGVMEVLVRKELDQSSGMGNSVDSTA